MTDHEALMALSRHIRYAITHTLGAQAIAYDQGWDTMNDVLGSALQLLETVDDTTTALLHSENPI